MSDMYQLVGTEVSMYTGKVRPYLRYKRIPFVEVLSTAQVYRTIIIPKTGVSYIPVLLTPDGETAVQDTTEIIDFLERRFPADPVYPATPSQRLVSLLFEVYADEWLVIGAMHYRWSYAENLDFIYREFGRTTNPDASPQDQFELGKMVAPKYASSLPFIGISDETKAGIEAWFEEFLVHLDRHFAQHAFLLGGKPTMGDFALMGPLNAHLSQDPHTSKLPRAKTPHVMQWIERMQFKNEPSAECTAEYLADDVVPPTLFPILQHMFDEHLPVLLDTLAKLSEFRRSGGESDQAAAAGGIPRSLGWHDFTVGGAKGRRMVFPYAVWMLQRPLDHYRSLTSEEQSRVDAGVLSKLQGGTDKWADALRATSGEIRVARVNNNLVWDAPQPEPQQQLTPAKI